MAEQVKRTYTEDVAFSMAVRHGLDRHLPPSGVMTWLSQRVQELEAQVAQLTQDKEHMLMFMRGVKACGDCQKCACEAAAWIDELTQEGQVDGSI
jgi:outer membrane murein-binding lipoprotein Lpp